MSDTLDFHVTPNGYWIQVIPAGGLEKGGYLSGLRLTTTPADAKLTRIRLMEPNGAPFYDLTGDNARLVSRLEGAPDGTILIPLELEDGTGILPNMSATAAYRLEVIAAEECDVHVEIDSRDELPDKIGTLGYWSNLLYCPIYDTLDGGRELLIPRVGNYVRNLIVLPTADDNGAPAPRQRPPLL